MPRQNTSFDFGDSKTPNDDFVCHGEIIEDRGSRYAVSVGRVGDRDDIRAFLKRLKKDKRYRDATHNSWAARISHGGVVYATKSDDGETGAGLIILRTMEKEKVADCVICVTRWFGNVKLMGDRFRHVQDATKYAIDRLT